MRFGRRGGGRGVVAGLGSGPLWKLLHSRGTACYFLCMYICMVLPRFAVLVSRSCCAFNSLARKLVRGAYAVSPLLQSLWRISMNDGHTRDGEPAIGIGIGNTLNGRPATGVPVRLQASHARFARKERVPNSSRLVRTQSMVNAVRKTAIRKQVVNGARRSYEHSGHRQSNRLPERCLLHNKSGSQAAKHST